MHKLPNLKIVSGGQAGADRAGLDAAIKSGIPHGGWCPRGRWAEDGILDPFYNLSETEASRVIVRTRLNVLDSDATIVFTYGTPRGGSLATIRFAQQARRPCLHIDLRAADDEKIVHEIRHWLYTTSAAEGLCQSPALFILNIAGSRESSSPGIYRRVRGILERVLEK